MAQKQEIIISYHKNGKSHRQIAKALGISRTTVFNVLKKYKLETGIDGIPEAGILTAPKYDSTKRTKRALLPEIQQKIDDYLAQNAKKVVQNRAKQQLKSVDIHAALESAGHQISYTTVCNYVRLQRQKPREVFIRQSYHPGQAVEFDWGEVRLTIMRVAVAKFALKNKDKEPTEDLRKLSFYYHFDYRFCNVRKGNEKGFVERSVEYIRRKSFAVEDKFVSLSAANDHLFHILGQLNAKPSKGQTDSIQSRFEEENGVMQAARQSPYDAGSLRQLRIDKYSCIKVDTNYYSVPEDYPHKTIEVKIYPETIRIYGDKGEIIQHQRRHTRFQYYLHLTHYLKTLRTKPGALAGAKSLQQADGQLQDLFQLHFKNQPKIFIELLLFIRQKKLTTSQLVQAVNKCHQLCPHQAVCEDKIKLFLTNPQPTTPPQLAKSELANQIQLQAKAQLQAIQALFNP